MKLYHDLCTYTVRIRITKMKVGSLEVIAGPMFCGKTEELIRRVRRAVIAKKKVAVFKHTLDIRYRKRNVVSHSKISLRSTVVTHAKEILKKAKNADIVAVDEAMWFGRDLIPIVNQLIDQGKRVIVSGLSTTFDAQPFEPIPSLMAVADKVDKLTSVCNMCGKEAIFHKKIGAKKENPFEISAKHVGEKDTYEARCRTCFNKE